MNKTILKLTVGLITILFGVGAQASRPNIVIIMVDDIQFQSSAQWSEDKQALGSYNPANHTPYTPQLNRLAAAGLQFTRAYSSSTTCAPARYSVLTGRYAGNNQSADFLTANTVNQLPGEEHFLSRVENVNISMEKGSEKYAGMNLQTQLSKAGYTTGIVGKWHLGQHVRNSKTTWENYGMAYYDRDADPASDAQVNQKMRDNQRVVQQHLQDDYGWDHAKNIYLANLKELKNTHLNVHNLEWTVKGAFEFMELALATPEKPFFMYFNTTLHHGPGPFDEGLKRSMKADVRYTGDGYYPEGVKYQGKNVMPSRQKIMEEMKAAGHNVKDSWTLYLDKGVEALMNKIDELGISDNTLVIFTSDHGQDRYGKASLLEGGTAVPLFMVWKGKIPAGKKIHQLVQGIDYAPTLYHYAGILDQLPADYHMDGKSLHRYIETQDNSLVTHQSLFFEMGFSRAVMTLDNHYIAVRYPHKIQRQIKAGKTWRPYSKSDALLTKPYLLNNKHLGHYASFYNDQYWNKDQYYDHATDPQQYHNLLYNNNDTRIPESQLAKEIIAGRDRLQGLLKEHLKNFSGSYFGEFYSAGEK